MRTVIITGASKGIGHATAQKFSQSGDRVINVSRTAANLPGVDDCLLDLTASDAASAIEAFVKNELSEGQIVLVHNAAKMGVDSVSAIEIEDYRAVIEINLVAPQILNQAVLPLMTPGSSILYIGSTLSEKAVPNSYSYVVTKHAIVGMMRATCQDLAGRGIHTVCICPGFTDTEMLRVHVGDSAEILDMIASISTFNRLITPDEIAQTICFAADNPVMNGAVVHANLGQRET